MIFIERNQTDEDGNPIRPNTDWFGNAADTTADAIAEAENHEVNEGFYKAPTVRVALEKLFNDKCAYCEWKPTGGSDWDVEHFRPKGNVFENEEHPGYYWLAYTWENLYLSCMHCNQNRKDKPRWNDDITGETQGKMDQFPIDDEADRAFTPDDDLSTEHTYLIDPCSENPEDYLGFDATGQIFATGDLSLIHI